MTTAIPTYVWQPSTEEIAERAGIDPSEVIRADQNTSPFTPPWAPVVAAMAASGIGEYPAAEYRTLRRAIANHVGADESMIVPGAGSDEMILLSAAAWLPLGAVAVAESPTYAMYRIATLRQGATFVEVQRPPPGFGFPADALEAAAGSADLTWLCVPHNPVGDRPDQVEIDRVVAASRGVTVVDAAYAEFTGDRWGHLVSDRPGLVVLGTLSKAFALAGARVGYAVANPDEASVLERLRPPGSISSVSVALALRALAEGQWMEEHVGVVAGLREELAVGLAALGFAPNPSTTNFVLCRIGPAAAEIAQRLMDRGVVVRQFGTDHPLADYLRFTVRLPEQQDRMLEELERASI